MEFWITYSFVTVDSSKLLFGDCVSVDSVALVHLCIELWYGQGNHRVLFTLVLSPKGEDKARLKNVVLW